MEGIHADADDLTVREAFAAIPRELLARLACLLPLAYATPVPCHENGRRPAG
jgi:hypothetical protein